MGSGLVHSPAEGPEVSHPESKCESVQVGALFARSIYFNDTNFWRSAEYRKELVLCLAVIAVTMLYITQ